MFGAVKKCAANFMKGWRASKDTPAEEKKELFESVVTTYAKKVVQPDDPAAEIARLKARDAKLLPVEQEVKNAIKRHISELACARLDAKYPRLNLGFLSFRNKRRQPQFGVFSTQDPSTKVILDSDGRVQNVLPFNGIAKHYLPTAFKCDHGYRNTALRTEFNGSIPDEARESIDEAREDFKYDSEYEYLIDRERNVKSGIGIIAAVDRWEEEKIPIADPLVVGIKGGRAWLICSFDLAPIEDYVLGTFTE